jgi:hypothetical protein
MESVANFLGSLSGTVFRIAVVSFLVINGTAIAVFALTRSRRLVDAWTPRVVTLDAVLLGAGLGAPLLAGAARLAVQALGGSVGVATSLFK